MYNIEHPDITHALRTGHPYPAHIDDEDAINEAVETFFEGEEGDDSCRRQ